MTSKSKATRGRGRNRFRAFTLFETLTVLFLCCTFTLLPVILTKDIQKELEVKQFFRSFEKGLLVLCETCIARSEKGKATFEKGQITYQTDGENLSRITVKLPEDIVYMQLPQGEEIAFDANGQNSKLPKIKFLHKRKNKIITYQFQMGSGKYRVSEEKN